jgi:hypothetical protein
MEDKHIKTSNQALQGRSERQYRSSAIGCGVSLIGIIIIVIIILLTQ